MSLLWAVATGHRMVPVADILKHYQPTDGKDWQEVHDNYVWDHPTHQAFIRDIKANGVREPIPVNYENDPPTVENGHTRVLAAHKAGITHVPVKDYEWFDDDEKS